MAFIGHNVIIMVMIEHRVTYSRGPSRGPRAPPLFFFLVWFLFILRTSKIMFLMIPRTKMVLLVFFSMFCESYKCCRLTFKNACETVFKTL